MNLAALTLLLGQLAAMPPADDVVDQFEHRVYTYTGGPYDNEPFHYRLLAPRRIEPGRKYPLVLFLHGAGERGDDNKLQLLYLPEMMASEHYRQRFECFLLAPQCRSGQKWVDVDFGDTTPAPMAEPSHQLQAVLGMLRQVEQQYPIDPQRLYLTGLSMGGYGSWDLAVRFPRRFAAVVPICGGGDETQAARLVDVPIWAVHGSADKAVPVERSRRMIEAIRRAGGNPRYLELEGVPHNSWTPAYSDPDGVLKWMFQQVNDRTAPPTN